MGNVIGYKICLAIYKSANLHFCRLFPTDLFENFIDIGHYVREISAYEELVSKLNSLLVSSKCLLLVQT